MAVDCGDRQRRGERKAEKDTVESLSSGMYFTSHASISLCSFSFASLAATSLSFFSRFSFFSNSISTCLIRGIGAA